MGQKTSTCEDTGNVVLAKKDSQDLKVKSEKSNQSTTENTVETQLGKLENYFVDVSTVEAEKPNQLELSDLPTARFNDGRSSLNENDNGIEEAASAIRAIDAACRVASLPQDDLNTDALSFVMNANVANVSNLTALRMVRNFEEIARINELLQNQIYEMRERSIEDNVSEKDFRTISYEDLPTEEVNENEEITLKRDSSTYTNEIKEFAVDDFGNIDSDEEKADKLSCKEEESLKAKDDDVDDDDDGSTTLKNEEEDEDELEELGKLEDEETSRLREKLDRLEQERDEAMLRLRLVEEKCEVYATESRSLEATLGSMEEKLRIIVTELGDEVRKSKNLEEQLSAAFLNSTAAP